MNLMAQILARNSFLQQRSTSLVANNRILFQVLASSLSSSASSATTTAINNNNIRHQSTTTTTASNNNQNSSIDNNNNNNNNNNESCRQSTTPSSSSISQEEVTKFSQMNTNWWDPNFHPLIGMNPIRVRFILDMVKQQQKEQQRQQQSTNAPTTTLQQGDSNGKGGGGGGGGTTTTTTTITPPLDQLKALDIGCGGGLLSESLARLGAHVTAIDPSHDLVAVAKQHAKETGDPRLSKIDYRGGMTVEELAASLSSSSSSSMMSTNNPSSSTTTTEAKYDIVTLLEVLEHVADVPAVIDSAASLVKKKKDDDDDDTTTTGLLFVSTMNRTWKSHLLTIVGAEYVMGYVPPGTHNWDQYLSPQEVIQIMDMYGMEVVSISGMVLSKPPPICGNNDWDWVLDPNDTDVNWIGAFRPKKK